MLAVVSGQALAKAVSHQNAVQVRNMATLKDISIRLKSVKNIQKITKSMKMVSAAKFARAERELRPARPFGEGAQAFYDRVDLNDKTPKKQDHLMVLVTSDRGLCGGIHTGIAKAVKLELKDKKEDTNVKIVCVGDKSKMLLQRYYPQHIMMSMNEVGRKPPSFEDASIIAQSIMNSGYKFNQGDIFFNRFKSAVSYKVIKLPIFSPETVAASEKLSVYDSVDAEVLQSYLEYSFANLLYYGLKENAASEQSARMTAMDGASKNAGEMIGKLSLYYNRTRQAVITRELIDIVVGASAL